MKELISAIQELNQPGCIDYIQTIATIISVFISGVALFYAISVPRKIAKEQNMISLFEMRYELFQFYENHIAFARSLQKEHKIEYMIDSCKDNFSFDCKNTDKDSIIEFIFRVENKLHRMVFLYPNISDNDVNKLYHSFSDFILYLSLEDIHKEEVQKEHLKELENNKNKYILCVDEFMKKYHNTILNQIQLYSIKRNR